ncbi:immunity 53 family protein [Streptomyces antibioticus]|uniref:immunity 53 family protein n=1 Tax=Streptomyces antibioticus TaxID=1890 RepID=UPI0033B3A87A
MTPRTFRGFNGKAVLHADRVEIKRAFSARIGGAKGSVVPFSQLVKVISKPPTRWLNGWVYLATNPDPVHLSYWADPPRTKVGGNPQAIVYTWFQRDAQADLLAAVSEAGQEPAAATPDTSGELGWLQHWYEAQCDGDWEHEWGVRIATLDNPGWTVHIDLEETSLTGRPYTPVNVRRSDSDWVMAKVSDDAFEASCGPLNLDETLRLFREWAMSADQKP